MPHEKIHPTTPSTGDMPDLVEIHWERDRSAHLAVGYASTTIIEGLYGPEARAAVAAVSEEQADFAALWVTLDRHQINQLIRVLRRARDAAYGRDE